MDNVRTMRAKSATDVPANAIADRTEK